MLMIKRIFWCTVVGVSFMGLAGCSSAAGYTQSPEELTPKIDIISGDLQSAPVNTAYTTPMKVRFNKNGIALADHIITFSAPDTGASGTFPDNNINATVVTDADGYAVAPTFTANGTAGDFSIRAWNTNYRAEFHLTNK